MPTTSSSVSLEQRSASAFESESPTGVPTVWVCPRRLLDLGHERAVEAQVLGRALERNVCGAGDSHVSRSAATSKLTIPRHRIHRVLEIGKLADAQPHEPGSAPTTTRCTGSFASAQSIASRWATVGAASTNSSSDTGLAAEQAAQARKPRCDRHSNLTRTHDRVPLAIRVESRRADRDARRLHDPDPRRM